MGFWSGLFGGGAAPVIDATGTALAVGTISVFAWVGQVVLEALKH